MKVNVYQSALDLLSTRYSTTYGSLQAAAFDYVQKECNIPPQLPLKLDVTIRQRMAKRRLISSLNVANRLLGNSPFPVDEETLDLVVTAILTHKRPQV